MERDHWDHLFDEPEGINPWASSETRYDRVEGGSLVVDVLYGSLQAFHNIAVTPPWRQSIRTEQYVRRGHGGPRNVVECARCGKRHATGRTAARNFCSARCRVAWRRANGKAL